MGLRVVLGGRFRPASLRMVRTTTWSAGGHSEPAPRKWRPAGHVTRPSAPSGVTLRHPVPRPHRGRLQLGGRRVSAAIDRPLSGTERRAERGPERLAGRWSDRPQDRRDRHPAALRRGRRLRDAGLPRVAGATVHVVRGRDRDLPKPGAPAPARRGIREPGEPDAHRQAHRGPGTRNCWSTRSARAASRSRARATRT